MAWLISLSYVHEKVFSSFRQLSEIGETVSNELVETRHELTEEEFTALFQANCSIARCIFELSYAAGSLDSAIEQMTRARDLVQQRQDDCARCAYKGG